MLRVILIEYNIFVFFINGDIIFFTVGWLICFIVMYERFLFYWERFWVKNVNISFKLDFVYGGMMI